MIILMMNAHRREPSSATSNNEAFRETPLLVSPAKDRAGLRYTDPVPIPAVGSFHANLRATPPRHIAVRIRLSPEGDRQHVLDRRRDYGCRQLHRSDCLRPGQQDHCRYQQPQTPDSLLRHRLPLRSPAGDEIRQTRIFQNSTGYRVYCLSTGSEKGNGP